MSIRDDTVLGPLVWHFDKTDVSEDKKVSKGNEDMSSQTVQKQEQVDVVTQIIERHSTSTGYSLANTSLDLRAPLTAQRQKDGITKIGQGHPYDLAHTSKRREIDARQCPRHGIARNWRP